MLKLGTSTLSTYVQWLHKGFDGSLGDGHSLRRLEPHGFLTVSSYCAAYRGVIELVLYLIEFIFVTSLVSNVIQA